MSEISFSVVPHLIRPKEKMVRILQNGNVIGAIYSDQRTQGIKIVSVHMAEKEFDPAFEGTVTDEDGSRKSPHPPHSCHVQTESMVDLGGRPHLQAYELIQFDRLDL